MFTILACVLLSVAMVIVKPYRHGYLVRANEIADWKAHTTNHFIPVKIEVSNIMSCKSSTGVEG